MEKSYIYVPAAQKVVWVSKRRAASVTMTIDEFLASLVKKGLTVEQSVHYFKEHVAVL